MAPRVSVCVPDMVTAAVATASGKLTLLIAADRVHYGARPSSMPGWPATARRGNPTRPATARCQRFPLRRSLVRGATTSKYPAMPQEPRRLRVPAATQASEFPLASLWKRSKERAPVWRAAVHRAHAHQSCGPQWGSDLCIAPKCKSQGLCCPRERCMTLWITDWASRRSRIALGFHCGAQRTSRPEHDCIFCRIQADEMTCQRHAGPSGIDECGVVAGPPACKMARRPKMDEGPGLCRRCADKGPARCDARGRAAAASAAGFQTPAHRGGIPARLVGASSEAVIALQGPRRRRSTRLCPRTFAHRTASQEFLQLELEAKARKSPRQRLGFGHIPFV
jgi:hypothetical protein